MGVGARDAGALAGPQLASSRLASCEVTMTAGGGLSGRAPKNGALETSGPSSGPSRADEHRPLWSSLNSSLSSVPVERTLA